VPVVAPKTAAAAALVESARCSDASIEVIVGQSRLVLVKEDLQTPKKSATLYIGDPTVADMTLVPPSPKDPTVIIPRRAIQIIGKKVGVTDLIIQMPDDHIFKFEVRVVPDPTLIRDQLDSINARLHCLLPDASLKVSAVRDRIVVEGEARSTAQVARILDVVRAAIGDTLADNSQLTQGVGPLGAFSATTTPLTASRVINLIRVMGSQQVLLKVRVAELNRTAMRHIGADFLAFDQHSPLAVGTSLGNASVARRASWPATPSTSTPAGLPSPA
jgi:pilus assembly protein CpaC